MQMIVQIRETGGECERCANKTLQACKTRGRRKEGDEEGKEAARQNVAVVGEGLGNERMVGTGP